jgi:hypothetical protein
MITGAFWLMQRLPDLNRGRSKELLLASLGFGAAALVRQTSPCGSYPKASQALVGSVYLTLANGSAENSSDELQQKQ